MFYISIGNYYFIQNVNLFLYKCYNMKNEYSKYEN